MPAKKSRRTYTAKKGRSPARKSATSKRRKTLPFKKWIQTIKDSKNGGQVVEDTKDKSPKRRGGL